MFGIQQLFPVLFLLETASRARESVVLFKIIFIQLTAKLFLSFRMQQYHLQPRLFFQLHNLPVWYAIISFTINSW
jgi:hypothetical protein